MSDTTTSERSSRSYTRRQIVKGAARHGRRARAWRRLLAACGSSSSSGGSSAGGSGGGSITIGSFSDPAMVPFRDMFLQASSRPRPASPSTTTRPTTTPGTRTPRSDGLQKTGAYDIYVMDDNWVPEFAAGGIVQSLDKLGLKVNPDILQKGLEQGYWPPKSGAAAEGVRERHARALYSLVIIDDVEILYYNKDYFRSPPVTWDDIYTSRRPSPSAAAVRLVGARRQRQPDRADLPAAAQLLRRQLRQRRLVAGLRRPGGRGRARAAVRVHPVHARPASRRSTPTRRPR